MVSNKLSQTVFMVEAGLLSYNEGFELLLEVLGESDDKLTLELAEGFALKYMDKITK